MEVKETSIKEYTPVDGDFYLVMYDNKLVAKTYTEDMAHIIAEIPDLAKYSCKLRKKLESLLNEFGASIKPRDYNDIVNLLNSSFKISERYGI